MAREHSRQALRRKSVIAVALLQARMSSSRLPGKVMLPVGGMPAVLLAARRAGNRGCPVRVATSVEASDDLLAATVKAAGIYCFRGSLDDTLGRMVGAIADLPDHAIVARLTADNMVPDGALIDELVAEFVTTGAEYLHCGGFESGLPYGVSAELTRARHIRTAAARATEPYDREHVTPWVRRHFPVHTMTHYAGMGMAHYRSTIDNFDDYEAVARIFSTLEDPAGTHWREVVALLLGSPFQPVTSRAISELVVGGAQLGMAYGIANASGQPSPATASVLVKQAIVNGATWIDTARAYGDSEAVIGRTLASGWQERVRIVTKLDPLTDLMTDEDPRLVTARIDKSLYQSLAALKVERVDALLLHRGAHLDAWGGAAWQRLLAHREAGRIGRLGISVGTPTELARALEVPDVGHIQLACNLVDHRWDGLIPALMAARTERSLTVHVRSAFLQGLLLQNDDRLWRRAHVAEGRRLTTWLDAMVRRLDRRDRADLCLAYVRGLPFVDGVVTGMETTRQLSDNLARFDSPSLTTADIVQIAASRPQLGDWTLDPRQWTLA